MRTGRNQRKHRSERVIQGWDLTGWKPDKNKGGRATRIQDKVLLKWLSLGSGLGRQGMGSGQRECKTRGCWRQSVHGESSHR